MEECDKVGNVKQTKWKQEHAWGLIAAGLAAPASPAALWSRLLIKLKMDADKD